jgi:hypothetical protein
VLSRGAKRTLRQAGGGRANNLDRFAHFIDANLQASPHIPRLVNRHGEGQAAVCLVRVIAPDIEIDAGGSPRHADDSQHERLFRIQDSGPLQAFTG